MAYYALKPDIKVIAPWREWSLTSRTTLCEYAEKNGIEVPASKRGEPPFSTDANLLHIRCAARVPALARSRVRPPPALPCPPSSAREAALHALTPKLHPKTKHRPPTHP